VETILSGLGLYELANLAPGTMFTGFSVFGDSRFSGRRLVLSTNGWKNESKHSPLEMVTCDYYEDFVIEAALHSERVLFDTSVFSGDEILAKITYPNNNKPKSKSNVVLSDDTSSGTFQRCWGEPVGVFLGRFYCYYAHQGLGISPPWDKKILFINILTPDLGPIWLGANTITKPFPGLHDQQLPGLYNQQLIEVW